MTSEESLSPTLSRRESTRLFNHNVRPALLGPATDHEQPLFVGIGGQPGIGKTTAQSWVIRALGLESAYLLDGDQFLPEWPGYDAAQRRNDLTSAYLASEALGGGWWQRAARILRAQHRDVVATYPMGSPGWDLPRLREFRDFGRRPYRVVTVYVVGHEALSLQGITDRYHTMRRPEQALFGRWVLPETHDMLYRGVLKTVDAIFSQRLAHELHGVRRDGTFIYNNDLGDGGQWRLGMAPSLVFEAERNRPWGVHESAEFLQRQGLLRKVTSQEWGPLLDTIDHRATQVIDPVVLLDDADLARRIHLLPLIHEQAVLDAERHGVLHDLLISRHRGGENERHLQQLSALGMPRSQVENQRNAIAHARWAQGMTVTNFTTRVQQLQELSESLRQEHSRRRSLSPEAHEAEDRGRKGAWPLARNLIPLPPAAPPVELRRHSPADPGSAAQRSIATPSTSGSGQQGTSQQNPANPQQALPQQQQVIRPPQTRRGAGQSL